MQLNIVTGQPHNRSLVMDAEHNF